jgi:hypothetical protein
MSVSNVGGSGSRPYSPSQAAEDRFAQFFNNLERLQKQDPEKLKTLLSEIADKLESTAQNATGARAQIISDLAAKYREAARTGDVSALKPPQRHQDGFHRWSGAPAGGSEEGGLGTA